MKSVNEFLEKMQSDEAFSKDVNEKLAKIKEEGKLSYIEAVIDVAKGLGFEVTEDDIKECIAKVKSQEGKIADEALDSVAGGANGNNNFCVLEMPEGYNC